MRRNLPTGSVTGKRGWDWNQPGAEESPRVSSEASTRRSTECATAEQPDRRRDGHPPVGRELQELRTELERTEDRLQYVIEHYEGLLDEKNRQLTADATRGSAGGGGTPWWSTIVQWVADRC